MSKQAHGSSTRHSAGQSRRNARIALRAELDRAIPDQLSVALRAWIVLAARVIAARAFKGDELALRELAHPVNDVDKVASP